MNKDEAIRNISLLQANLARAEYGLVTIQNSEELVPLGDNRFLLKSAFQSQDGKRVPLKWGYEQSNNIIGTADLKITDDGLRAECKINGEWYSEEHYPWEEQNCNFSMTFKEYKGWKPEED